MSKIGTQPLQYLISNTFDPSTPPPETTDIESYNQTLREINRQISSLRAVKPYDFLPFERKSAMAQTNTEIIKLEKEKDTILAKIKKINEQEKSNQQKHAMHIRVAQHGYDQQLDLTPLTMSGKSGPQFMVSPFNNPTGKCSIEIELEEKGWEKFYKITFKPKIPRGIGDLLEQGTKGYISSLFTSKWFRVKKATLTASFTGVAGEKAKEINTAVQKAEKTGLFDQILVIADVPEWDIDKIIEINKDPLIAGWVKKTGQLFYIAHYDMTPLEEYYQNSFAFGVTMPALPDGKN